MVLKANLGISLKILEKRKKISLTNLQKNIDLNNFLNDRENDRENGRENGRENDHSQACNHY